MNEIEQRWADLETEFKKVTPNRDNARAIIANITELEELEILIVSGITSVPEVTQGVLKKLIVGLDTEIINGEIRLKTKKD